MLRRLYFFLSLLKCCLFLEINDLICISFAHLFVIMNYSSLPDSYKLSSLETFHAEQYVTISSYFNP